MSLSNHVSTISSKFKCNKYSLRLYREETGRKVVTNRVVANNMHICDENCVVNLKSIYNDMKTMNEKYASHVEKTVSQTINTLNLTN